jgi:hypothetical protein
VNQATGFALQLGSAFFSFAASHVLTTYEIHLGESEDAVSRHINRKEVSTAGSAGTGSLSQLFRLRLGGSSCFFP